MKALIDGDIIAYRCAVSAEQEDQAFIPISRCENLVEEILEATEANLHEIFISGPGNFRREIYPAYKVNRKQPPPKWLETCERYLIDEWNATVTDGCEADDALGVAQMEGIYFDDPEIPFGLYTVICSIDKDLLQIPGKHYNFVKREFQEISYARGMREFYLSMLIGDATDNIKGLKNVGKSKAPRLLEGCSTEDELFNTCRELYNDDEYMLLTGRLLWIWRQTNGDWLNTHYGQILNEAMHKV